MDDRVLSSNASTLSVGMMKMTRGSGAGLSVWGGTAQV
jgi:hypothetical protein